MKLYSVLENERLCDIAKKFNISVQELADFNGITNINTLKTNDLIFIPSKGEVNV